MKRNINLIPLSKEHHFGLLCAWKIKEGIKLEISYDRIKSYINYFWDKSLENHFFTEDLAFNHVKKESRLFKMEQDHDKLHELVRLINTSQSMQLLIDFAELLQNHIRFEERELFPFLENSLSDQDLLKIGNTLNQRDTFLDDDYSDTFWKRT